MKRCTVEHLNFTRLCGNRIQVWWKILFCRIPANPQVKELLKSVHICQSYRKNKSGTFFNGPRCILPETSHLSTFLLLAAWVYVSYFSRNYYSASA